MGGVGGFSSPSVSLRIWDKCGRGEADGSGGKGRGKEGKGRENSGFESPSPSLPPVKMGVMGEQGMGLVERGEELGGFGSPSPSPSPKGGKGCKMRMGDGLGEKGTGRDRWGDIGEFYSPPPRI